MTLIDLLSECATSVDNVCCSSDLLSYSLLWCDQGVLDDTLVGTEFEDIRAYHVVGRNIADEFMLRYVLSVMTMVHQYYSSHGVFKTPSCELLHMPDNSLLTEGE